MIAIGDLTVIWPNGSRTHYHGTPGPSGQVRLLDHQTVRRLVFNPSLGLGEGYMSGTVTSNDLYALLEVFLQNSYYQPKSHRMMWLQDTIAIVFRRLMQLNSLRQARRNIAHYDLDGQLYSLFLDQDRQYSCAYFPHGDETLEAAQLAKKRHIAAKLCLDRPGLRVLDIGCGWGGMALTIAREFGAHVIGITLSQEQLTEARARATAAGLADRVQFILMDYRTLQMKFDRVVSIGMFEHVGLGHYAQFFQTIRRCLKPDGVALIHAIGRSDGPGSTNPWLQKYIFPGGYSPALSEVLPAVEKSGLIVTDLEILRVHYAQTLRHWRQRFAQNRATIADLYDETFCRMFEFYLAGCEGTFRYGGHMVWQLQLAGKIETVPLTRDYISLAEGNSAPSSGSTSASSSVAPSGKLFG